MKLKLIILSSCAILGQAWAAAGESDVLAERLNVVNRVSRSLSADSDIRLGRGRSDPKSSEAVAPRDDDAESEAPSTLGGRGGAASVYTTGTVGTVSADKVTALIARLKEALTANNAMGAILTGISGKLEIPASGDILRAVDLLKARITAAEGRIGSLVAVLGLEAGQDPLEATRREHDTLTQLKGILAPEAGEDMVAAATRVQKQAAEVRTEVRALELRHASELTGAKAAYEAEIARLRAEFKAEMDAKERAYAETLGLVRAQLATKEEERKTASARVSELEKVIRLASTAISRRELDLANQLKSTFMQQGIAEERARYYRVLATTYHERLSSWTRPKFVEFLDKDALEVVTRTYEDDCAKIAAEIARATRALGTAPSLEVDAIVSMLAEEASRVASGTAPASTLVVEMPGSAKKIIGGGSHRKLSRASDPGVGKPPLVPTGGSAAMGRILAAASASSSGPAGGAGRK